MIKTIRWRWGIFIALAIALLSMFPQASLWRDRGKEWNGGNAFFYTDEPAYAAYINALIDGRPRRNDPYTGRDDTAAQPLRESLFSIQFIPAYLVAVPARSLGVSTATVFTALTPIVAFATALAVFWLFALITNDDRAAAALVPFVLCLGVLMSGNGIVRAFLGQQTIFVYLPFLRRYVPAVVFPCFIVFFPLVWLALTSTSPRRRIVAALVAGLAFTVCVYGYFFHWTAALAWVALIALLWIIVRPAHWRSALPSFALIGVIALAALLPYAFLLSHRAPTMDTVQALVYTHAPDLSRSIEIIALLIVIAIAVGLKLGRVSLRDPRILITTAFALLPFVVFNQQIVTGRSLQPMHYEQFVVSYTTLIAAALALTLLWRGKVATRRLPLGLMLIIGCVAYAWGMGETWISTRRFAQINVKRDETRAVPLRLRTLAASATPDRLPTREVVFAPDFTQADYLPTAAPQAVLWAPHMFVFSGVSIAENKERFFQFLYYSGVGAEEFERQYQHRGLVNYAIFGWERANPRLTVNYAPITSAELAIEVKNYADYIANFDRTRATQPTLSYVILDPQQQVDLSNLDRWYTRDAGERIGRFLLCRLTPR